MIEIYSKKVFRLSLILFVFLLCFRNHVWVYTQFLNNPKQPKSFTYPLFRGFKYGLIAAVITTFAEKAFYNYYYGDDGHSHH